MWGLSASIGDSPIGRPSYGGETWKLVGNHLISPESSRPHPSPALRDHRPAAVAIKLARCGTAWVMIAHQIARSPWIVASVPGSERADATSLRANGRWSPAAHENERAASTRRPGAEWVVAGDQASAVRLRTPSTSLTNRKRTPSSLVRRARTGNTTLWEISSMRIPRS